LTIMIDRWFGVPQAAVRLGKLKQLSGVAVKVYLAICHDSERYRTRELTYTTKKLIQLVGGSPNSHRKARAELVKLGLVVAESFGGDGYVFEICNPATEKPWPLHPKVRVPYEKKAVSSNPTQNSQIEVHDPTKMDAAGTDFPYGFNDPQLSTIPPIKPQKVSPLAWEDIGSRES
jgi:hypothetical protein